VAVEVLPNNTCHCPYAFCAAANKSRDLVWVLATTPGVDCGLGDWVGEVLDQGLRWGAPFSRPRLVWPGWEEWSMERDRGGRDFDARSVLRGLSVAATAAREEGRSPAAGIRAWAAAELPAGGRACGGLAVQVVG